jgi:hypothetical protein
MEGDGGTDLVHGAIAAPRDDDRRAVLHRGHSKLSRVAGSFGDTDIHLESAAGHMAPGQLDSLPHDIAATSGSGDRIDHDRGTPGCHSISGCGNWAIDSSEAAQKPRRDKP